MNCVVHDLGIVGRPCTCADVESPHLNVRLHEGGHVTAVAVGLWDRPTLADALRAWADHFSDALRGERTHRYLTPAPDRPPPEPDPALATEVLALLHRGPCDVATLMRSTGCGHLPTMQATLDLLVTEDRIHRAFDDPKVAAQVYAERPAPAAETDTGRRHAFEPPAPRRAPASPRGERSA